MRVIRLDNVAAFARCVRPMLVEREAENCFLLGRISELSAAADGEGQRLQRLPFMWAVEAPDGGVVAAAMMSTPDVSARAHPLVVTRSPADAVAALVHHFRQSTLDLPGVSAPAETADAFADAWCAATGLRRTESLALGLYRLTRVVPPRPTPGSFRPAAAADAAFLVSWADAFFRAVGEPESREFC